MAPYRGIVLILCGIAMLTLMSAFVKAASDGIPTGQVVFFRAALSLPVIAGWLWARGDLAAGLHVENWRGHAARGIVGSISMGLGFSAIALLPLAEVQAIRFATPVFLVIFAALLLGERFRLVRLAAVAVGLVGVLVIVWPRLTLGAFGGPELTGAGMALASAGLAALAQTIVKAISGTERPEAISFTFLATAATLSAMTLPFGWVWPTPGQAGLLVGAGVLGAFGQMLLTASYAHADASSLAPFTYTSMIWAVVLGFVWFGEVPTWQTLAGGALIIVSGLFIVLRERRSNRQQTARRKIRAKGMM